MTVIHFFIKQPWCVWQVLKMNMSIMYETIQMIKFLQNMCLLELATSEIIANSVIFYFAGYETTATTLSLLAHNLAINPDIQDRVYKEVNTKLHGVMQILINYSYLCFFLFISYVNANTDVLEIGENLIVLHTLRPAYTWRNKGLKP